MFKISQEYLRILKKRDFFVLTLTLLFGQIATGLFLITLVSSVFAQTGSNFGVSGVILSLSIPSFLLIVLAGFAADLVDRKKLIILANFSLAVVVFLILLSIHIVFASISLSFLYFAGNNFFFTAATAASAQLVKKTQLAVANSMFISTLAGGIIFGLFAGAVTIFLFGKLFTLVLCEILLVLCVFLPMFLPKLIPAGHGRVRFFGRILDIAKAFSYIFKSKINWFFFLAFAATQGIVSFGVTLTPGFFDEIVRLPIHRSPLFVLPLVGLGIILGSIAINFVKIRESFWVLFGLGVIGISGLILGLLLKLDLIDSLALILLSGVFTVLVVFGVIVTMTVSRTALQRRVAHSYQGTVFGANIMLGSFMAAVASPLSATFEVLIGYTSMLIFGGIIFLLAAIIIGQVGIRWKF